MDARFCDTPGVLSGNYMRVNELEVDPILNPMPGPWAEPIKQLRLRKGLTQKTVARRARITATTYGRIEKGHHTQTQLLQRIADAHSVPIEAVLHIQFLQKHLEFSQTPPSSLGGSGHAQAAPVLANASVVELDELRTQVHVLKNELAEIAAEQEAERRRRRSQRLSGARVGKPGRVKNARKSRS